MAKNWTEYLEEQTATVKKSGFGPSEVRPELDPWYDARRWNVNDWASFVSIFGTAVFWVLERKKRYQPPSA